VSELEAGLICIFIEPRIINQARVSYIQAILRHYEFKYVILVIKGEF